MDQRQELDTARTRGRWLVECEGGRCRYLLDLDRGAIRRSTTRPTGRSPLDGTWWVGARFVEATSGASIIRVGGWARWLLSEWFVFAGPIERIAEASLDDGSDREFTVTATTRA